MSNISVGKISIKGFDHGFVTIQQYGQEFFYNANKSANNELLVTWKEGLNPDEEKSSQVCLINNNSMVVWTKDFRRASNCKVANNGTVAILDLNPTDTTYNGKRTIRMNEKIIIAKNDGAIIYTIEVGYKAEIMAMGISPNGKYLAYSIQQYKPMNYHIVLFNLETCLTEWRHEHSKDIVIHDLILTDERIDVYSGPRPSAYCNKQYNFSLDYTGRKFSNKNSVNMTNAISVELVKDLGELFSGVAPTVMVETEEQLGPKRFSQAMTRIMNEEVPLPAIRIMLFTCNINAEDSSSGKRYFFGVDVVARSADESKKTAEKTIQRIDDKEDDFICRNIAISSLDSSEIAKYSGSGPFPRYHISSILKYPSIERRKKLVTFESLFVLNADEKVEMLQDVRINTSDIWLSGKLALTNRRLSLYIKNPISGSYTACGDVSRATARNLKFGTDTSGQFFDRASLRVYFQNNQLFADFRRRLNSYQLIPRPSEKTFNCSVCGKVITKEASEGYDGKCWECWDDEFTEESDTMFGQPM